MAIHNVQEESKGPRRVAAAKKAQDTKKEKQKKKADSVKSASTRGRVSKKEKAAGGDKEKKKRGPTAFFVFSAEQREAVKKANPEFKITEIASKLGEMWRGLSADKKAVYEKKAADAAPKN